MKAKKIKTVSTQVENNESACLNGTSCFDKIINSDTFKAINKNKDTYLLFLFCTLPRAQQLRHVRLAMFLLTWLSGNIPKCLYDHPSGDKEVVGGRGTECDECDGDDADDCDDDDADDR